MAFRGHESALEAVIVLLEAVRMFVKSVNFIKVCLTAHICNIIGLGKTGIIWEQSGRGYSEIAPPPHLAKI